VVEVDPDVGCVRVLRLAAVDDCGVVVNPALVEGQVLGSIVQGLGQALYEQVRYDEAGQPLTATLLDYSVPTAAELPEVVLGEHVTPNPNAATPRGPVSPAASARRRRCSTPSATPWTATTPPRSTCR
jgi:carbon-monoxide dehydrogenase large subunit